MLRRAIDDYYFIVSRLINHFTNSPDIPALDLIGECDKAKKVYEDVSERYLISQEAIMRSLLYDDLTIDQIKARVYKAMRDFQ